VDLKELRSRVTGAITTSADSHYERLRRSMVWNQLVPERRPSIIVQVANENAVVEAVRFARANQMKVAVRGGGHSWIGLSLSDNSLLIDLGRLKNVSIDRDAGIAVVQPAVSSREFNRRLVAQRLAFPVGHGPTVPMSGFLLSGGVGWNYNAWGPACFSIEAARVITADGSIIVASEKENTELLWAVRGAGPGFFGVVTEYTLRLFPAPEALTASNYYYPIEVVEEVGAWGAGITRALSKQVEFAITIGAAPALIADRCRSSNGWVCSVSAIAFVNSPHEAASTLAILDSCPVIRACLRKDVNVPTSVEALHDLNLASLPEGHRYLVDTFWTNSPPAKLLALSREHLMQAPSPKSFGFLFLMTGPERRPFQDGAYSMSADNVAACSAVWERPEDDTVNREWHRAALAALDEYAVGHYVGESDIIADPGRAERSYSKPSWERLKRLREKYDPDALFHGYFSRP
jgi:FAD/FMN-containing dehydrogenase